MKLLELFSSNVDYKVRTDTDQEFTASALIGTHQINFEAEYEKAEQGWWITFTASGKGFAVTGDGQAPKVLAFVKRCIEDLLRKHDPEMISFSGAQGKHEVYKRMVQRFIPKDKYKITSRSDRSDGSVLFRVTKKEAA
jgi:hypothetical protein